MPLSLYNTRTRTRERFETIVPGHVGLYVCGPTVYDLAHVGNARPVVVFDVLYRVLKRLFPSVTYVRNITDVDDKIIAASKQTGRSIAEITSETTLAFHQDAAALKALTPTHEPRATQYIAQMQAMIQDLLTLGHAYEAEGHVLFHVPSMPDYGALSGRNREEMLAGARVDVAPYKRDAADFVLWKPSTPDVPGWDSPWGYGRPGWHIECSAMSKAFLGQTFDIHGGGLDLIFPHHENEIAQSRCAHGGCHLARYWVHNGFVMINGQKMSKSLGNFFTVRQLLEEGWPGEVIRLVLLTTHYRQPLDFTRDALTNAQTILDRWYSALAQVPAAERPSDSEDVDDDVLSLLCDDLNVPAALARLHELASALNKATDAQDRYSCAQKLVNNGAILGLLTEAPQAWLHRTVSGHRSATTLDVSTIEAKIDARTEARRNRDFATADQIREDLAGLGIVLEDHRDGRRTTWRRT